MCTAACVRRHVCGGMCAAACVRRARAGGKRGDSSATRSSSPYLAGLGGLELKKGLFCTILISFRDVGLGVDLLALHEAAIEGLDLADVVVHAGHDGEAAVGLAAADLVRGPLDLRGDGRGAVERVKGLLVRVGEGLLRGARGLSVRLLEERQRGRGRGLEGLDGRSLRLELGELRGRRGLRGPVRRSERIADSRVKPGGDRRVRRDDTVAVETLEKVQSGRAYSRRRRSR